MTDYRRVFRWRAEDSPNVRLALLQRRAGFVEQDGKKVLAPMPAGGKEPSRETLVPGVLTWDEYCHRRLTWDVQRQTVGLDALFYMGAEQLLFPPSWLARAATLKAHGKAVAMGIDPGEGMANTAWAVISANGLLELASIQTPDTTQITSTTLGLMHKYNLPPGQVCFDRGGGGKQHADRLRSQQFPVRTVAFGETLIKMPKHAMTLVAEKIDQREDQTSYVNRRAEMYWELSALLDPTLNEKGFAIPASPRPYDELHRQLGVMPKLYDQEGRAFMLPKNKKGASEDDDKEDTLVGLLGCSPDEADALAVAVWSWQNKNIPRRVGRLV